MEEFDAEELLGESSRAAGAPADGAIKDGEQVSVNSEQKEA